MSLLINYNNVTETSPVNSDQSIYLNSAIAFKFLSMEVRNKLAALKMPKKNILLHEGGKKDSQGF